MKVLVPGDIVVVTKLDRLARSSRDLHNILHELKSLSCGFVSVGEAWCDTTTDVGRLMLTIMGGIAEFERGLIRKRCEEGIARAKRKGTQFGRPTRLDAGEKRTIADRYAKGATMEQSMLTSHGITPVEHDDDNKHGPGINELRYVIRNNGDALSAGVPKFLMSVARHYRHQA
jgi:DNA invertase Pin-like site-specific DNA recombinase